MKMLEKIAHQIGKCETDVWGCSSLSMYLLK